MFKHKAGKTGGKVKNGRRTSLESDETLSGGARSDTRIAATLCKGASGEAYRVGHGGKEHPARLLAAVRG